MWMSKITLNVSAVPDITAQHTYPNPLCPCIIATMKDQRGIPRLKTACLPYSVSWLPEQLWPFQSQKHHVQLHTCHCCIRSSIQLHKNASQYTTYVHGEQRMIDLCIQCSDISRRTLLCTPLREIRLSLTKSSLGQGMTWPLSHNVGLNSECYWHFQYSIWTMNSYKLKQKSFQYCFRYAALLTTFILNHWKNWSHVEISYQSRVKFKSRMWHGKESFMIYITHYLHVWLCTIMLTEYSWKIGSESLFWTCRLSST